MKETENRAMFVACGSFLLMSVYLILALTQLTPIIAVCIIGIFFSIIPTAMWPAVALVVKERCLATAYGLLASIQSLDAFTLILRRVETISHFK